MATAQREAVWVRADLTSFDGTGVKLTGEQLDLEKTFLKRRLKESENALEQAINDKLEAVSQTVDEQLFGRF